MRRTGDTDAPARPAAAGSEQNGRGTGSFSQPSHGSNTADPHKVSPAVATRHEALIAEFKLPKPAAGGKAGAMSAALEEARAHKHARFRWALEVEAALAAGEPVGDGEAARLRQYQQQPEYLAMRKLYNNHGAAIFVE